jgi:aspartate aminotransferase
MAEEYLRRRDLVKTLLDQVPGFKSNLPTGAFYFFPDVSQLFGKSDGETVIHNADDLCLYLLDKAQVSLVTGDAFGDENCIRISYAASEEDLREAITRIKAAVAKLS